MSTNAVVMMLTDGRFPSGGHAYSAGMEQAIDWGDVVNLATTEAFVVGRVRSVLRMAAEVVATANIAVSQVNHTATIAHLLDRLDEQVSARMASGAARAVSHEQGRRWIRAVRSTWPGQLSNSISPTTGVDLMSGRHGVVVLGAATAYLGVQPADTATIALYDLVGSPVSAAVRLLGLDPSEAASVIARLLCEFEPLARSAATAAVKRTTKLLVALHSDHAVPPSSVLEQMDMSWISWLAAPLSDLAAEAHLEREERLFAS